MTLVIVVAAIVALILLGLIMVLSRSRFSDEGERFRYVSGLTSQWSRQQQHTPSVAASTPAESIDLRDSAKSSAASAGSAPAGSSGGGSSARSAAGSAADRTGSSERR